MSFVIVFVGENRSDRTWLNNIVFTFRWNAFCQLYSCWGEIIFIKYVYGFTILGVFLFWRIFTKTRYRKSLNFNPQFEIYRVFSGVISLWICGKWHNSLKCTILYLSLLFVHTIRSIGGHTSIRFLKMSFKQMTSKGFRSMRFLIHVPCWILKITTGDYNWLWYAFNEQGWPHWKHLPVFFSNKPVFQSKKNLYALYFLVPLKTAQSVEATQNLTVF